MNSGKKALRLAGGISTIVVSSILLMGAFMVLALIDGLQSLAAGDAVAEAAVNVLRITTLFLLIFSLAAIVLAALLCANKKPKIMAIILAVLMAGLAILEFVGSGNNGEGEVNTVAIVYGVICLIITAVLVAYLFVKDKPAISQANENINN